MRIEPLKDDQAPSAILELVDGPKDMRFHMTAKTIARAREEGLEQSEMTIRNVEKVTRYRKDGEEALEDMVSKLRKMELESSSKDIRPKWK